MENNKEFTWNEWKDLEENENPTTTSNLSWDNSSTSETTTDQPSLNWDETEIEVEETPNQSLDPETTTDQPSLNWDETKIEVEETPNQSPPDENITLPSLNPENTNKPYSALGSIPRIEIKNELYQLYIDNEKAIKELKSLDLTPRKGDEGRYDFDPKVDTELGNIIQSIVNIGFKDNLKVTDCNVIVNKVNESVLNIFRGKPTKSFLYILQGNNQSGDIILDLASMGGPSTKLIDNNPGFLSIFDGWVPFHISKNNSDDDLIIITGTLGI